ncbi:MAG: stage sporulation protein cell division protein FtsW [Candidatus Parcubacteria bacterium]|jgi:cell division protein FtsW
MTKPVYKPFLISVIFLLVSGLFIFASASLGLLARDGASFTSVAFNQIVFGIIGGGVACVIISRIPYKKWRPYSFYIFIVAIILNLLVFVPGIGMSHGGATRWLNLGISFQPSEFLKIAFILYFAAWLSGIKNKIEDVRFGMLPTIIILGIVAGLLLAQPDTDTFLTIAFAGIGMYVAQGAKWRDLVIFGILAVVGLGIIASFRPYIMSRITTFIHPSSDPQGAGYQVQQSLIAIGSGGFFGRGFGQSIQKFNYLPEPIGDSIYAVASEEFGLIGSVGIILLFVLFSLMGLKIAVRSKDSFGRLIVVGIVILVSAGSFMNIASMLGLIPLGGIPLTFISHGGTALFFSLAEVGIVMNISRDLV